MQNQTRSKKKQLTLFSEESNLKEIQFMVEQLDQKPDLQLHSQNMLKEEDDTDNPYHLCLRSRELARALTEMSIALVNKKRYDK
jgi:hypothetical protein